MIGYRFDAQLFTIHSSINFTLFNFNPSTLLKRMKLLMAGPWTQWIYLIDEQGLWNEINCEIDGVESSRARGASGP